MLKVGDYVRTKNGYIGKALIITEYNTNIEDKKVVETKDIIKSSPNIIDLFEEHDLVVIEYYSLRYNERVTRLFEVDYKDEKNIVLENSKCSFILINNDFSIGDKKLEPIIKSIVTKEQFESMEYKVGDKND